MENISKVYLERLMKESNSGLVLAGFYSEAFDVPNTRERLMMFHRLVKLYGRESVFYSILDMTAVDKVNPEKPFGLLAYFCKQRLQKETTSVTYFDTSKMETRIEKVKKQKFEWRNPIE